MKLKYYLRGLGTGILVTTFILFVAYSYRNTTEKNKSEETTEKVDTLKEADTSKIKDEKESSSEEQSSSEEPSSSKEEESSSEQESTSEETTTQPDNSGKIVELIINRGDNSSIVAGKLYQLGVISDAKEFDRYLCQKGLDGRISTGVFKVKIGASYEEVANIITY